MTFMLNTKPIDDEAIGYLEEALRLAKSGELKNFILAGELTHPDEDGSDLYYGYSKIRIGDALDLTKEITLAMIEEYGEEK